jgi:hypothetical protein
VAHQPSNISRWAIITLAAVIALFLLFPGLVEIARGGLAELFSSRGDIVTSVLGFFLAVAAFIYTVLGNRRSGGGVSSERARQPSSNTATPTGEAPANREEPEAHAESEARAREEARKDAQDVARGLNLWSHDRMLNDPFSRAEDPPTDTGSPEYRELSTRYDEYMNESERQYQNDFLPDVARVRATLGEHNIRDALLDKYYSRPRTHEQYRTVAEQLWDMSVRLKQLG